MNPFHLLLTLSLLGCYNPDLSGVRYTCDEKNPFCPGDLKCVNGWCGGAGNEADGATVHDASVDMSPPMSGCKDGTGKQLDSTTWACPGVFTSGQISSRCAANWSLCQTNTVPKSISDALTTFFASAARGTEQGGQPDQNMVCDWASHPSTWGYFLFGLGRAIQGSRAPQFVFCGQFPAAINLDNPGSNGRWTVKLSTPNGSSGDFLTIENQNPDDGVLCCR